MAKDFFKICVWDEAEYKYQNARFPKRRAKKTANMYRRNGYIVSVYNCRTLEIIS